MYLQVSRTSTMKHIRQHFSQKSSVVGVLLHVTNWRVLFDNLEKMKIEKWPRRYFYQIFLRFCGLKTKEKDRLSL